MSSCRAVEHALSESGVLILQDKIVRSVVGIITGERLSTSWWSHAKGGEIFACLQKLGDDPDVLVSRLIAGKVTYVHRKLWPAFLALACSNEPWQTSGLSANARELLRAVIATSAVRAKGPAARELQERLLVQAEEVHTESGRHETLLQPWSVWRKGRKVARLLGLDASRIEIENAVTAIGGKPASLPWHRYS